MISKRRNITLVIVVVIVYIWYYSSREVSKRLRSASSPTERSALTDDIRNMITLSSSPPVPPPTLVPPSSSSTPPPSAAAASVNSTGVGRRPDDGLWYDFSDPPSLLFYAYSAFVDDRPLEPRFCNNHLVVIHIGYRAILCYTSQGRATDLENLETWKSRKISHWSGKSQENWEKSEKSQGNLFFCAGLPQQRYSDKINIT